LSRKSIFTAPEKLKICKSLEQGASISQLARSLGVGLTTLEKWRKEYQYYGEEAFERPTGNRSYSKEFKEQVVLEYYRDGPSLSELAGKYQISYSVIASWVETWDNGVNLSDYHINPGVYAMASRKTTPQERTEIVQWVLDHDLNYTAAAEQFQIKYATIYRWTKQFLKEGDAGLDKKIGRKPNQAVDPESLSETERLKWELEVLKRKNYRLELENQVLKKKEELENRRHTRK
jgi:transposase-like protein